MRNTPQSRGADSGDAARKAQGGNPYLAGTTLLLSAWAAFSALTIFYVVYSGVYLPFQDDWKFTRVFSGEDSLTFGWVWDRHWGHAFPLTRLLVALIWRIAESDSRWVYLLNAALASAGTLWLNLSVVVSRKRASFFDLILVIHGVSLVHHWSLLQNINLSFMIYLFLFCFIVGAMLREFWNSLWLSAAVGLAVILLSINAGYGLAVSLVLTPYLGVVGLLQLRNGSGAARARGMVLATTAALATVGCAWAISPVVMGEEDGGGNGGLSDMLGVSLKALGMAWPRIHTLLPSAPESITQILVLVVTGVAVLVGLIMLARRREDRPVLASLAAAFLAVGVMGGAIGFGRVDRGGEPGVAIWYATLAAPFPMTAYLILDRMRMWPLRVACVSVLLLLSALSWVQSWRDAWWQGSFRRASGIALTRDARAGVSGEELHARYHEAFAPWDSTLSMAPTLDLFRARGLGPYDMDKAMWMGQFEEPRSRELKWRAVQDLTSKTPAETPTGTPAGIGAAEPGEIPAEQPDQGRVKALGKALVLRVDDEESWFRLTLISSRGTRPWLLEMEVWSPAATQMRFSAGEGDMEQREVAEGLNTLQFMIVPRGGGGRPVERVVARFSPGRAPGNYRLEGTRRYELP